MKVALNLLVKEIFRENAFFFEKVSGQRSIMQSGIRPLLGWDNLQKHTP